MQINDISVTPIGVQVVVTLKEPDFDLNSDSVVTNYKPGDKEWPRFLAMAEQLRGLVEKVEIKGLLTSVERKKLWWTLVQYQFSWKYDPAEDRVAEDCAWGYGHLG